MSVAYRVKMIGADDAYTPCLVRRSGGKYDGYITAGRTTTTPFLFADINRAHKNAEDQKGWCEQVIVEEYVL